MLTHVSLENPPERRIPGITVAAASVVVTSLLLGCCGLICDALRITTPDEQPTGPLAGRTEGSPDLAVSGAGVTAAAASGTFFPGVLPTSGPVDAATGFSIRFPCTSLIDGFGVVAGVSATSTHRNRWVSGCFHLFPFLLAFRLPKTATTPQQPYQRCRTIFSNELWIFRPPL
jgi:hypothetical protein